VLLMGQSACIATFCVVQVNEAALLAAKRGADAISGEMIDYAYDKVLMGVERKSAVRSQDSLRRTAYHESGHALVSSFVWLGLPHSKPVRFGTVQQHFTHDVCCAVVS
jgi:ATP-dependent Zn protease